MQWIDEGKENSPMRPDHVLIAEPGETLQFAFVEYWKRILTEGSLLPRESRETVGIEILARDEDEIGAATATFYTSRRERRRSAVHSAQRSLRLCS